MLCAVSIEWLKKLYIRNNPKQFIYNKYKFPFFNLYIYNAPIFVSSNFPQNYSFLFIQGNFWDIFRAGGRLLRRAIDIFSLFTVFQA